MLSYKRLRFDNAGYFFFGIFLIACVGFFPTYLVKLPQEEVSFNFYTHFHAGMMILWLGILITQPFLIRTKRNKWHKLLGKFTYAFFPLLIISMLLLMHSKLNSLTDPIDGNQLWIPLKDLVVIVPCFCLAIYYRKNPLFHARFIIGSSIQLIEPGLARALIGVFPSADPMIMYGIALLIVYSILITLIVKDRKSKKGRWIFPLVLGMVFSVHLFLFVGGPELDIFRSFMDWFIALPLT